MGDDETETNPTGRADQADDAVQRSVRGRITRATGRNTDTGGRGLPKVAEIVMTHNDGRVLEAGLPSLRSARTGTARLVRAIDGGTFSTCPICLEAPADTREHVPPKPLGGVVMTYTCGRCNGGLGSRTESAMQDWFDSSFRISYTRGGDPAHFGHNRVLYRQTPDGEYVLLHEKSSDVLGDAFRAGGTITSHQLWPHPNQYKTGLLKNAYLAACLSLRGVPEVESADEIRAELLAARDAKSRTQVRMGDRARDLRVHRTGAIASGPPLALVYAARNHDPAPANGPDPDDRTDGATDRAPDSGTDNGEYLLSLAGTLLVSWPFPEVPATGQFVPRNAAQTEAQDGSQADASSK